MNVKAKFMAGAALSLFVGISALPSYAYNCGWQNFGNEHPRRAEVLRRDANLNRVIFADRGHLDGHFWQLRNEDRAIRMQEQRMAQMNGGYITPGQQYKLNWEENRLAHQIRNWSF